VLFRSEIASTAIDSGASTYWSEANLYKADDLSAAIALDPGMSLLTNADYDDAVTAGVTTQGMWDDGWGYFMYSGAATNVAAAVYSYGGNADSLAANADQGVGGQPVAVFNNESVDVYGVPADGTSFTDAGVAYSWAAHPDLLAREMKESLIASPSNLVVANTDTALTEYVVWLKGGTSAGDMETMYSDITIDITQLLGDVDLNDVVDGSDFNVLLSNWGTGDNWDKADFDADGTVDGADFNHILTNWSAGGAPLMADVPEPATMTLLVIGGIALIRRKRQ